jgi:mono/diheme cytochrome c family protein
MHEAGKTAAGAGQFSTMLKKAAALVAGCAMVGALALLIIAPRLNWSATATPPALEKNIATAVLRRWVKANAPQQRNPLSPSADNLRAGQREFGEHCATCHGADGSTHNWLGADFYPPVARLERGAPHWSDSELYFVIENGIRYTGMPGFGVHHDAETIWQIILWIRHLPGLTAAEKAQLKQQNHSFMEHQERGD